MTDAHDVEPGSQRASDADRDSIVARLNTASGEGRISIDEFNDRVGEAYAAKTLTQLDALMVDLPPVSPWGDPGTAAQRPVQAARPGSAHADRTRWHVSPIGGVSVSGRWRLPRKYVAVSLIGGAEMDLRDAVIEHPVSEVVHVCLIGGVDLRVPPDVRVEISGFTLLGGRSADHTDVPADAPARARLLVAARCLLLRRVDHHGCRRRRAGLRAGQDDHLLAGRELRRAGLGLVDPHPGR
ncbi:MAG: DUF1707 SHOCT-like domain-containing protein [Mycobacteriales bacterium]